MKPRGKKEPKLHVVECAKIRGAGEQFVGFFAITGSRSGSECVWGSDQARPIYTKRFSEDDCTLAPLL